MLRPWQSQEPEVPTAGAAPPVLSGTVVQEPAPQEPMGPRPITQFSPYERLQLEGIFGSGSSAPLLQELRQNQQQFATETADAWFRERGIYERVHQGEDAQALQWVFDQYREGGAAWAEAETWLAEDSREGDFRKYLKDYEAYRDNLLRNPMRSYSALPDASRMQGMLNILQHPQGMQAVEVIAGMTDDPAITGLATHLRNTVNTGVMAHLFQGQGVGAPLTADQQPLTMTALAQEGIAFGERHRAARRDEQAGQAEVAMDMRGVYRPQRIPDRPVDWFQNFAFSWSAWVGTEAAKYPDLEYEAIQDVPVTVGDAERVFRDTLELARQIDTRRIQEDAGMAYLVGGMQTREAFLNFAQLFYELQQTLPEGEAMTLGQTTEMFQKLATGEITKDTEMPQGTNIVVSFLNLIGTPDRMVSHATTGGAKKVQPRYLRFDDGYSTDDPMEAMQHYLKLLDEGAVDAANPASAWSAEAQRWEALHPARGETYNPDTGEYEYRTQGAASEFGETLNWFGAGVGLGFDFLTGGPPDPFQQDTTKYARPTAFFDTTQLRVPGGGLSRAWSAMIDGEGQYLTESIYEAATNGTAMGSGHLIAAGVGGFTMEVLLSPWNFLNTGTVSNAAIRRTTEKQARAILAAGAGSDELRAIFKEVLEGSASMTKAERRAAKMGERTSGTARFLDGAEMNEDWAAARRLIIRRFGGGGKNIRAGAEDIADLWLTRIRDNPGSFDAVAKGILDDPKFLDQFALGLGGSGIPDVRIAAAQGGLMEAREAARRIFRETVGDVKVITEQAAMNYGRRSFWDTTRRAHTMENARGVFIGRQSVMGRKMGVDFSMLRRHLGAAGQKAEAWAKTENAGAIRKAVRKAGTSTRNLLYWMSSQFHSNYWSLEGIAAQGLGGSVGHVERIPYRMRKLFEDKYRRRMAAASQLTESEVGWLLGRQFDDGSVHLLDEWERRLVTIAVELGEDSPAATVRALDGEKRELLEKHLGSLDLRESKFEVIWENVESVRHTMDSYGQELRELGVLGDDMLIREDYLTRFYRNPEARKKYLSSLHSRDTSTQAARSTQAAPDAPGHMVKGRFGPETIFEAIRIGLDPELDSLPLLLYRSRSQYEATTKYGFLEAIAATYGRPMMKGREAVLEALNDGATLRWAREGKADIAARETAEYGAAMHRFSALLKNKSFLLRRRNVSVLARSLGLSIRELTDERLLLERLPRSEKFLRLAASGRRNVLDGFLPESLRESLKGDARELLALRRKREAAVKKLREVSPDLPLWATVVEEDAGAIAKALRDEADKRHSAATQQVASDSANRRPVKETDEFVRTAELDELSKRLKASRKSLAYFEAEGKTVAKELAELEAEHAALLKKRDAIVRKQDSARDWLAARGYDPDSLSAAGSLDDVSHNGPVARTEAEREARHRRFAEYVEQQRAYETNFKHLQSAEADLEWVRQEANKALRNMEGAKRHVRLAQEGIDAAKAGAKDRRAARVGAQRQKRKASSALDAALEKLDAIDQDIRWRESRMSELHGTAAFRENARHVSEYAKRTGLYARAIKARATKIAQRFNVNEATLRARATQREALPEFVEPRTKNPPEDELARMHQRARASAKGYMGLYERSLVRTMPYSGISPDALPRYRRAEATFRSFDITGEEQAAMLWEAFGARNLTDVPIEELEMFADRMMVKMGRLLSHPADETGRIIQHAASGADGPLSRVESALGLRGGGSWEKRVEAAEDALEAMWEGVEAGDEKALAKMRGIDPADLSELYVPNSVSEAVGNAVNKGILPKKQMIRAGVPADYAATAPLMRHLSNTYIPAELGMAYRMMVGEGLIARGASADFVLSQWLAGKFIPMASIMRAVTRPWKGAVTSLAGDFRFGRRNGWFDGARTWFSLGFWEGLSPGVQKAFREEMIVGGPPIQTASGPVERSVFHSTLKAQGITTVAARTDDVENFARSVAEKREAALRGRSEEHARRVVREANPTGRVSLAPGGGAGFAIGAAAGEALGVGGLAGAQMGHQVGAGIHLARNPAIHTSGAMPTLTDWLLPFSPQAAERLENYHRAFTYWSFVKSGMSPQDAVRKMNDLLRDYSNLVPSEHGIYAALPAFYNFTKQNAIAQWKRLLESPSRATFLMRAFRSFSEAAGGDNDSQGFFNHFNALVSQGKVWFVSDELEAMVSWMQPAVDLLWNQSLQKAGASATRLMAPTVGEILARAIDEDRPLVMPQSIARNLYERHGAFHGLHASVWKDKDGIVRGEWEPVGRTILTWTGLSVGANSAGRVEGHVEEGDIGAAFIEYLGFGRVYDARSPYEGDYRRLRDAERLMVEQLEQLRFNSYGRMEAYLGDASPEEKEAWDQLLNDKDLQIELAKEQQDLLRRIAGKSNPESRKTAVINPNR